MHQKFYALGEYRMMKPPSICRIIKDCQTSL